MADFMKTLIKDFQQNHSSLQIKIKEVNQKLDYESKINLISEIKKRVKEDLNDKVHLKA
jgi:ppGpp synthetase/RelA/SpoT-type nucleotidyltranferase